jgi:hypothetical protein
MAMNLFSHVLRSGIPADDSDEPAATAALDSRRWVFRDLVVRRDGHSAWGLLRAASTGAATARREPSIEPLWPDTQPWCHK